MLYPAPSAAVRAIRRIRPDLPDEEIPLVHEVREVPEPADTVRASEEKPQFGQIKGTWRYPAEQQMVIHRIDRPYAAGVVEVYGEPDMGWYEWRIVDAQGAVLEDSGRGGQYGQQYGSPAIALRDAIDRDAEATG